VTPERAVWVTGVGAVTAAGIGAERLGRALLTACPLVHPVAAFGGLPAGRAPEPPRGSGARRLDRSAALFLAAANEAWCTAGLPDDASGVERCGLIEGSCLGPLGDVIETIREHVAGNGTGSLPATGLIRFMTGAGGLAFAQLRRLRGPVAHLSAASVSSACAIGDAMAKIAVGLLDVVVVGGAECPLQCDIIESLRVGGVLATPRDGAAPCCPFDARRSGTVLGEGAGVLVLEAAGHATRRGAQPRAILTGFGLSRETYSMIRPDPTGAGVAEAARSALGDTPVTEIGWIKTHGTGTRVNDAAECHGLAAVFGDQLPSIPLVSLKPMVGHCLGASGVVEAVAALLALEQGVIPATLGTTEIDPALPACRIATDVEPSDAGHILLLAESFGGRCAAVAMRRP